MPVKKARTHFSSQQILLSWSFHQNQVCCIIICVVTQSVSNWSILPLTPLHHHGSLCVSSHDPAIGKKVLWDIFASRDDSDYVGESFVWVIAGTSEYRHCVGLHFLLSCFLSEVHPSTVPCSDGLEGWPGTDFASQPSCHALGVCPYPLGHHCYTSLYCWFASMNDVYTKLVWVAVNLLYFSTLIWIL